MIQLYSKKDIIKIDNIILMALKKILAKSKTLMIIILI